VSGAQQAVEDYLAAMRGQTEPEQPEGDAADADKPAE
jgi:hypothetical protein